MQRQTFWVDFTKARDPGGYMNDPIPVFKAEQANLVSSALVSDKRDEFIGWAPRGGAAKHAPVIDLDVPARLVPSSTPGNSHLYLDIELEWETYMHLLKSLAEAGIVESGYVEASIRQGATFVRPEGVVKGVNDQPPHPYLSADVFQLPKVKAA